MRSNPLRGELFCGVHGVSPADAHFYYDLFLRKGAAAAEIEFPKFVEGLRASCSVCQKLHAAAVSAIFPVD